jgi:hypothetical protein
MCWRAVHAVKVTSALLHHVSAEGFFVWLWQPLPRDLRVARAFFALGTPDIVPKLDYTGKRQG